MVQPAGSEPLRGGPRSEFRKEKPVSCLCFLLNTEHLKDLLIAIPNRNCLTHLVKHSACKGLIIPALNAVKAQATIKEIKDVLRDIFGEYEAHKYWFERPKKV